MSSEGYIKLFRKFSDWEWYNYPSTKILFIHLLIKANWKAKEWQGKIIKRGQYVTSIGKLMAELEYTKQQIRTALANLKSSDDINIETNTRYTLITIKNYDGYQSNGTSDNTPTNTPPSKPVKDKSKSKTAVKPKTPKQVFPCDEIVETWNAFARQVGLATVQTLTPARKKKLELRLREGFDLEKVMEQIRNSSFLRGDGDTSWRATLDWLTTNSGNWIKVVEEQYRDPDSKAEKPTAQLNRTVDVTMYEADCLVCEYHVTSQEKGEGVCPRCKAVINFINEV